MPAAKPVPERTNKPFVSAVMPCLNEARTIGDCIKQAQKAIADHHLAAEIVVADNGSTDGSQQIATQLGARVINISQRGYGAALMGAEEWKAAGNSGGAAVMKVETKGVAFNRASGEAKTDAEGRKKMMEDELRKILPGDTEVALLALTGAEPRLIARILHKLPPKDATTLRHRLEHPGPLRLRDVEQARAAVAAVASRLAHEGTIELPASVRFAAAV
jgi:nitrogenase molybdenum-iron protein alpha/beta subunit